VTDELEHSFDGRERCDPSIRSYLAAQRIYAGKRATVGAVGEPTPPNAGLRLLMKAGQFLKILA
jgi:hypothetical protein